MNGHIVLPPELNSNVGAEQKDFALKSKYQKPLAQLIPQMIAFVIFVGVTSFLVVNYMTRLLNGENIYVTSNNVVKMGNLENLQPLLAPGLMIGFLFLLAWIIFIYNIVKMVRGGGYFVGTNTRLVSQNKGKIRSIDWQQFTGETSVSGNATKGNVSLQLKNMIRVGSRNKKDIYKNEMIYFVNVRNAIEIEKICRTRIKENDITPVQQI
jgi:hypothetical protein